jgi:hypothetical protein
MQSNSTLQSIYSQIPAFFSEADRLRLCYQALLRTKTGNIVPAKCTVIANKKSQISIVEFINRISFQYKIPGILDDFMGCVGASLTPRAYDIET